MAQERARQRELAKRATAEPSFYLEQKKEEYKTFATEYVEPVVESGMAVYEHERAKEEVKVKEAFEEEVAKEEAEALMVFEEQLAQAKATIPSEARPSEIAAWEIQQRQRFTTEVSVWKSTQESTYQAYIQQWRTAWRPRGLAQRLFEWKVPTTPVDWMRGKYGKKAALPEIAGIVASFESFTYGLVGLTGIKTPKAPPTLSGAVISKYVFGKPSEMQQLQQYPQEYVGGTLIGDVLLTLATGKAVEKLVIKPLSPYAKRVGGWVREKVGWGKPRLPPSIRMPPIEKTLPKFMSKEDWYKFYTQTIRATSRPVRVKPALVRVPWRVTTGAPITPMAKTLAKVAVKYPPSKVGGGLTVLQELTEQVAVKYPFSLKTAIAPYLMTKAMPTYPSTIGAFIVGGQKLITHKPSIKGFVVQKPKPITRLTPWQPLKPKVMPKTREALMLRVAPITQTAIVPKVRQKTKLQQRQMQRILLARPHIQRALGRERAWPRPRRERREKYKKRRGIDLAAWFFKRHPVPTPQELIKKLGG